VTLPSSEYGPFKPPGVTHLLAIERVGPSHADNRCYTMRGRDVTESMWPAHAWFLSAQLTHDFGLRDLITIGIGDGGNEIGMGKIPRDVIARNIPRGDLIACSTPTQHLIVSGVSNWGAYALAAGVLLLRGQSRPELFGPARERAILQRMVEEGPLVDGVTGLPTATVDGLGWADYSSVLEAIRQG